MNTAVNDIVSASLIGLVIAFVALIYGFVKGRAIGWREGYFERESAEKKRRDKLGRFQEMKS